MHFRLSSCLDPVRLMEAGSVVRRHVEPAEASSMVLLDLAGELRLASEMEGGHG